MFIARSTIVPLAGQCPNLKLGHYQIPEMLDAIIFRLEASASSLFRLMDRRVAGPMGEPNSVCESAADRGERCAASRAFNGSSPTANLISIIKVQGMS
jgi:hypothetical protein